MSVNETIRSKDQIIRRVQKATEMDPPWAGIGFVLDIGSDELADQLRVAYPGGKNLRARKHMAVIDFLGMELEKMGTASESTHGSCPPLGTGDSYRDTRSQSQDVQVSQLHVSYPHSVVSQASPSVSSSLDSPRIKELPRHTLEKQHTPDALNDPGPNTGSGKGSEKAKMAPAVPVVTAQTFVFNATDGKPVQPRSKKTMSNQERQEYKKTRQRGACMKCRRTKAKVFKFLRTVSARSYADCNIVYSRERITESQLRYRFQESH